MPTYTCDPKAEVIGENVMAFLNNVYSEDIYPHLEMHQLTNIEADVWYPLQSWLHVLSDLTEASNSMMNLVSIGMAIAKTAILPPEVQDVPFVDFLRGIDSVYQEQHRGADVGHFKVEEISPTHIKLIENVVYPDDLEYGVLYGFSRRFLDTDLMDFTVQYDQDIIRQDQGGDTTVIHIKWGTKAEKASS